MNKIGMLTGILVVIFGIVEKMTPIFYIGLGFLIVSLLAELFRGKIGNIFSRIALHMKTLGLRRYRKHHYSLFQQAEEWFQRLASQYPFFVKSDYMLNKDGSVTVSRMLQEKEEAEVVLHDFVLLLQQKGIIIMDEWIRLEMNRHVMQRRIHSLESMMGFDFARKPTIPELLQIFIEEGPRVEGISSYRNFWNRAVLLYYIESNYTLDERYQSFSRTRKMDESIDQVLQKLDQEYRVLWRLQQLEEWLLGSKRSEAFSIHQFDQTIRQFSEFRKGIVYVLEKLGYRVTLPNGAETAIHLIIERSKIIHGVILQPLEEGYSISVSLIHELHTVRTLADLQSIWIITNRDFAIDAKALATKLGFICIDRERLSEWMVYYANPFEQTS